MLWSYDHAAELKLNKVLSSCCTCSIRR